MHIDTHTLTGPALDWAVSIANGDKAETLRYYPSTRSVVALLGHGMVGSRRFSEDYSLAGPLMEKHGIAVRRASSGRWFATYWYETVRYDGATMLEAAMRCYAASMLGPQVDIPDELLAPTATIIDHDPNYKPAAGDWTL